MAQMTDEQKESLRLIVMYLWVGQFDDDEINDFENGMTEQHIVECDEGAGAFDGVYAAVNRIDGVFVFGVGLKRQNMDGCVFQVLARLDDEVGNEFGVALKGPARGFRLGCFRRFAGLCLC